MANPDLLFSISAAAAGEWSAEGKLRFHQRDGSQFGGYISGLMMTAVLAEPARNGAPASMTGAFLARASAGPLTIKTTLLRAGSTLEFWRSEIVQGEKLCAESTITLARRPASAPHLEWLEMPPAAQPESLPRNKVSGKAPPHLDTFDIRIARGGIPYPSDGISWAWTKEVESPGMDYPRLAMF